MTSADRPPTDPPWAALEALAAGELTPAEARALERRIQTEQGWADAYAQARKVEQMLEDEHLLPVPLHLVQRVVADIMPAHRESPWRTLMRVAAAVLVFCASWIAFSGSVPALADIAPHDELNVALPAVLPDVPAAALTEVGLRTGGGPGSVVVLVALGLCLVGLGVWMSLRWQRRAAESMEVAS